MSAVAKPGTVDQLARALAPHLVLVHHDFSQTPEFALSASNVRFVPNPKKTGWAVFGFVDGIFHSMQYAVDCLEFDYLQVLSPTCLPIKPLHQFEAHVSGAADANYDCVDLLSDSDALMSVGYRAFLPEKTLRHLIVRRLSLVYFGRTPGRRDEAGIWLRSKRDRGNPLSWLALTTVRLISHPRIGWHIFDSTFRPYYGTTWFGARRDPVAAMAERYARPGVREYFSRIRIPDEFLIPTLLQQVCVSKGPMNHLIQVFDQAHPGRFEAEHFEQLRTSPAFFARKFADDPSAAIRLRVLGELASGVGVDGPGMGQSAVDADLAAHVEPSTSQ